jgi:hypothetical protein
MSIRVRSRTMRHNVRDLLYLLIQDFQRLQELPSQVYVAYPMETQQHRGRLPTVNNQGIVRFNILPPISVTATRAYVA